MCSLSHSKVADGSLVIYNPWKTKINLQIGERCLVKLLNQPEKRGTISFIGETKFKPGYWIGVTYDEPLGKNDGSVGGERCVSRVSFIFVH